MKTQKSLQSHHFFLQLFIFGDVLSEWQKTQMTNNSKQCRDWQLSAWNKTGFMQPALAHFSTHYSRSATHWTYMTLMTSSMHSDHLQGQHQGWKSANPGWQVRKSVKLSTYPFCVLPVPCEWEENTIILQQFGNKAELKLPHSYVLWGTTKDRVFFFITIFSWNNHYRTFSTRKYT